MGNKKGKINKKIIWFGAGLLVLLFGIGLTKQASAQSASLYFSPSSGNYTVGNNFSLEVRVNTGGVAINAADGTILFDVDSLEVTSISKSGSIFSLWVQDPVYSNALGTINFAGGKPSPGYAGSSGTIIIITFRVKTAGVGNVSFVVGSALADDGKGTNILSNMGSAVFNLNAAKIVPTIPVTPPSTPTVGVPALPVVSSGTHPDSNQWYSNNDPTFSWQMPIDVTGVSLLLHEKPTANPGSQSDGLLDSKKYEDVADGVWYFHIKFYNGYGWSATAHRKVLIDTQPPDSLKLRIDDGNDATNPTPVLYIKASDALSGIDYYEIKIGEQDSLKVAADSLERDSYKLPPQPPGTFALIVKAVDRAGNSTMTSADLVIEPITSPVITECPKSLKVGDVLQIKGTSSYPETSINIFIKRDGGETLTGSVEAGSEGNWLYINPKSLDKGDYEIWAIAVDKRGAQSNPTEKIKLVVTLPIVLRFGKIAIDYLTVMTTLIVLIVGAIAIGFYAWYRISLWRKKVRKETKEVMESITRAFRALREEVEEQIELLDEKPGLTKAERKVRDKLKEALSISEEFISKEVKDVEKELE